MIGMNRETRAKRSVQTAEIQNCEAGERYDVEKQESGVGARRTTARNPKTSRRGAGNVFSSKMRQVDSVTTRAV